MHNSICHTLQLSSCVHAQADLERILQEVLASADVAAGLSLGEYTALAFAEAFR